MNEPTENTNIVSTTPLISPMQLKAQLPISEAQASLVVQKRKEICQILSGKDSRLMVIVGPCSIHDVSEALGYADRLAALSEEVNDHLLIVMRCYFEKPRTTIGWKGLISDPDLDGSFNMEKGLRQARQLLCGVADRGLPAGTEMLDPITPQYIADLVGWASIGARTTESQTHRQMASGLSMPVGFKNGTNGDLQVAIDAMRAARHPHAFLGVDAEGQTALVKTKGNSAGHLILRGGSNSTNYDAPSIAEATRTLEAAKLPSAVVIDCSHGNSRKNFRNQAGVFENVLAQRLQGAHNIAGVMLESNLAEGQQPYGERGSLKPGVSITDGCMGWEETERLIRMAYNQMKHRPAAARPTPELVAV